MSSHIFTGTLVPESGLSLFSVPETASSCNDSAADGSVLLQEVPTYRLCKLIPGADEACPGIKTIHFFENREKKKGRKPRCRF